jgi:hypothetical protein
VTFPGRATVRGLSEKNAADRLCENLLPFGVFDTRLLADFTSPRNWHSLVGLRPCSEFDAIGWYRAYLARPNPLRRHSFPNPALRSSHPTVHGWMV